MKKAKSKSWVLLVTVVVMLALLVPAIPAYGVQSTVNLVLSPSSQTISKGGNFTIIVQAQCGAQTIDGIQVYLDYDPVYLAVQSAAAGPALPTLLLGPTWDNTTGSFGFSAGQSLGGALPSGTFTVVTLTFQAKNLTTSPTAVNFHTSLARKTLVDKNGDDITGTLIGGNFSIVPDAPLKLDSAFFPLAIYSGQTFSIDIKTNVNPNQQVSAVQTFVNFDVTKLEVVDADPVQSGIQIVPGTNLPAVLENTIDTENGLVMYSAGTLSLPFPTGVFTVATIQFRAKTVLDNATTPVTISLNGVSSTSMVMNGGTEIAGTHANTLVQIIPGANVFFNVALQGGLRSDSSWVVPLNIKLFTSGSTTQTDVLSASPLYVFNVTTSKNGSSAVTLANGVIPGTYDITAVSRTCLINVKRGVVVAAPSTNVDMGILLEGNANDDVQIDIQDFGILSTAYGTTVGDSAYDARVDFDLNGVINIADFGLLAANYGKTSPQTVTAQ